MFPDYVLDGNLSCKNSHNGKRHGHNYFIVCNHFFAISPNLYRLRSQFILTVWPTGTHFICKP